MVEGVLSEWDEFKLRQACDGERIAWLDCKPCGLRFRILAEYDFAVKYTCPVCRSECILAHVVKKKVTRCGA